MKRRMALLGWMRRAPSVFFALGVALVVAFGTYGAWHAVGEAVNLLTTGAFGAKIEEDYEPPGNLMPMQTVKKIVNVKNTGKADAIVRVKVETVFGTLSEKGDFLREEEADPGRVEIHYDESGLWKYRQDGYFYYCDVLPPGEITKVPLMDSYTLSEKAAGNTMGKEGRILINMESVQAAGNAVAAWDVTKSELGIPETLEKGEAEETKVVFDGDQQVFLFEAQDTDLFAAFKNLLPGTSRTQPIRIENRSDTQTVISLRAVAAEQEAMSGETLAQVKDLLETYAQITISDGDQILYQGPVSGNLQGEGEGKTMAQPIELGTFEAHEERTLMVSLSVSPQMDSRYQKLLGKVGWEFQAGGGIYSQYPYTGDDTPVILLAVLSALSAAVVGFLIFLLQKRGGS